MAEEILDLGLATGEKGSPRDVCFKIRPVSKEELESARINYLRLQREDRNNFCFWAPFVRDTAIAYGVRFPESVMVDVDPEVMDAFAEVGMGGDPTVDNWFHEKVVPVLEGLSFPLFVKNGCFSNKFDFANNCYLPSFDPETVLSHLKSIQSDSFCYDTFGNNLFVFREWIASAPGTPTIYNGMPLRPEMRLFYNFDKHEPLFDVNYWDWDCCHDRIAEDERDKEVYEAYYPALVELVASRWERYKPRCLEALSHVEGLSGKWSVDFLLEEEAVWLIDMAEGERSAYWRPS